MAESENAIDEWRRRKREEMLKLEVINLYRNFLESVDMIKNFSKLVDTIKNKQIMSHVLHQF
ncbi:unnamed protein product [Brugia timori]|uniref:Uncharacterized protein n=1 Tax=Brugia timori TaxID=42155 RepID=A0A0R3QN20_9BILA|nr:unnamed protein product [Brugia timori]